MCAPSVYDRRSLVRCETEQLHRPVKGLGDASSNYPYHLYAPEVGFDPAMVALKFTRQVRREAAARAMGWSIEDYDDITSKATALADREARAGGRA